MSCEYDLCSDSLIGVVLDSVVERHGETTTGDLGFSVLGLTGDRSTSQSIGIQESKSMQEMLFTVFEEAAQSEGILRELEPEHLSDPEFWDSSDLHMSLIEGEIVRLFTPVTIVDPHYVQARLERFANLNDGLATMIIAEHEKQIATLETEAREEIDDEIARIPGGRDKQGPARKRLEAELKRRISDVRAELSKASVAPIDAHIKAIFDLVNRFLSADALSVRFPACGDNRLELAFSGSLLGRSEYIQDERDALFSRYGSLLQGWTSVVQVATIPTQEDAISARERDFESVQFADDTGVLNRSVFERTVIDLLGKIEAIGIAEGPLWPGVSVIPLGIYRVVPRTDRSQLSCHCDRPSLSQTGPGCSRRDRPLEAFR